MLTKSKDKSQKRKIHKNANYDVRISIVHPDSN